jgi:hypothetical protein
LGKVGVPGIEECKLTKMCNGVTLKDIETDRRD